MLDILDRWLTAFETVCLALGTGVAVTVATVQVLLRYFANTGIFWAEELTVYTVVWTAFLAAGAAVRSGEHLSVELVQVAAGRRHARALHRLVAVVGLVAGAALAFYGVEFVITVHEFGQLSPALQWPMWIVYLVIPLSGILLGIRFLQQIVSPAIDRHDDVTAEGGV